MSNLCSQGLAPFCFHLGYLLNAKPGYHISSTLYIKKLHNLLRCRKDEELPNTVEESIVHLQFPGQEFKKICLKHVKFLNLNTTCLSVELIAADIDVVVLCCNC